MGQPSPEEKERNLAIADDFRLYKKGEFTMPDLVIKYHLSESRIRQIGNNPKYQR